MYRCMPILYGSMNFWRDFGPNVGMEFFESSGGIWKVSARLWGGSILF